MHGRSTLPARPVTKTDQSERRNRGVRVMPIRIFCTGGLKEPRVKSSELRRPTLRARLSLRLARHVPQDLLASSPVAHHAASWRSDARASVWRSTASPRWSRRPHCSRPPSATDGTDATARTGGGWRARRHRPPRGSTETCRRVTSRPRRPPCRIRGFCSGSSPERPRMSSRRPTARRRSSGSPTATPTARRRLPPRRSSSRYPRRTSSSRRAAAAEGASREEAAGEAALDGRARSGAAEARGPDGPARRRRRHGRGRLLHQGRRGQLHLPRRRRVRAPGRRQDLPRDVRRLRLCEGLHAGVHGAIGATARGDGSEGPAEVGGGALGGGRTRSQTSGPTWFAARSGR